MSSYIFLDTWVYSLLSNEEVRRRLALYIRAMRILYWLRR